ncbi:anti-sigma factor domain-containing protein [Alkalibacillus aidingensis]|uniref:anti-sigma factor domain-containing protein n=1 Tax=Alkalibacillus aidingensis TaxID=2747607 RepID=UPI001660DD4B|nr:anti-sigma factor domain-containing protein [Alkalibacillus aidingensis]
MKGIVVEKKGHHHIVMTSDGSFYKTKLESAVFIGEEVTFNPLETTGFSFDSLLSWVQNRIQWKAVTAFVLCLALVFPFYSWINQEQVHAYVSIDINPSIELSVDQTYEVIGAEPLNSDGSKLLDEMGGIQGQSLQNVSSEVLILSKELGYLEEDHNIFLGISYADQLLENEDYSLDSLSSDLLSSYEGDISITSFIVPKDIRDEAKDENTSMNVIYASEMVFGSLEQEDDYVVEDRTESDDSSENPESNNQSEDHPQEDRLQEVMEHFLEKSNRDDLPPGLQKKIDDSQTAEDQRESENQSSDQGSSEENDHPSENGKNNGKGHQEDQSKDGPPDDHPVFGEDGPPGQNKSDDDEGEDSSEEPDQENKGNSNNNNGNGKGNGNGNEKGPGNKGNNQGNKGSSDKKGPPWLNDFVPPGLNKKNDD